MSIKEGAKEHYFKRVIELLEFSKSNLNNNNIALRAIFSTMKSNAMLMKIENSRDIIRDSIKKLDTALVMFKSMHQYCETTAPKDRIKIDKVREGRNL